MPLKLYPSSLVFSCIILVYCIAVVVQYMKATWKNSTVCTAGDECQSLQIVTENWEFSMSYLCIALSGEWKFLHQ